MYFNVICGVEKMNIDLKMFTLLLLTMMRISRKFDFLHLTTTVRIKNVFRFAHFSTHRTKKKNVTIGFMAFDYR